jgi:hypothetical protein
MSDEAHSFDCQDNCDGHLAHMSQRGRPRLPSMWLFRALRTDMSPRPAERGAGSLGEFLAMGDRPTRCRTLGWWIGEAAFASW